MLIDLGQLPKGELPVSDVVIVGGGTVGLFVGVLLARKGISVTITESGGLFHEIPTRALNEVVLTGRPHAGALDGRARVLGGTSTLWGGQLTRFLPVDLDARAGILEEPWPLSYAELLEHYAAVAAELALDPKLLDDEAVWRKLGLTNTLPFNELSIVLTRWLKEPNLAQYFQRDIGDRSMLRVICHATAVDLEYEEASQTVKNVVVVAPSGARSVVNGKTFILASGTIEISRFLLWTAHSHPAVPWAGNRWLGRTFQDHIDLQVGKITVKKTAEFRNLFENIVIDGRKYQPKLILPATKAGNVGLSSIACSFIYLSRISEHLSHLKTVYRSLRMGRGWSSLWSLPKHLIGAVSVWFPLMYRYIIANRIYSPFDKGVVVNLHCEQAPVYESAIRLSKNLVDANQVPLAEIDWRLQGDIEFKSILEFCRRLTLDLNQNRLGVFEPAEKIIAEDDSFLDSGRDSYHQCGGARMASSPEKGVVDAQLKVFGAQNLYVAGAAAFPSSSFANPTFTAFALGHRLVQLLSNNRKECNGS